MSLGFLHSPKWSKNLMKGWQIFLRPTQIGSKAQSILERPVKLYLLFHSVVDWVLSLTVIAEGFCYLLCPLSCGCRRVPIPTGPWRVPGAAPLLNEGNSPLSWGDTFSATDVPTNTFPYLVMAPAMHSVIEHKWSSNTFRREALLMVVIDPVNCLLLRAHHDR